MYTLILIIWILLGIISVWRTYHGTLKSWYDLYKESYWKYDKENNNTSAIRWLIILSPIFIMGGGLSLILFETLKEENCWYFTTKTKI